MTEFPTALDEFTNPIAGDKTNSENVPHHEQHANLNDAMLALQAKVGVDDSTEAASLDKRVTDLEGATSAGGATPGNGSPEGVVDGDEGAFYWQRDAGNKTLWIKGTNGGNTGWEQLLTLSS